MSQNSPKGGSGWVKTGDIYENFIRKFVENSNIVCLIKGELKCPKQLRWLQNELPFLPFWLIQTNE